MSATDTQSSPSIEDQIALCRAFAERHGWVVGLFSGAKDANTAEASEGAASDKVATIQRMLLAKHRQLQRQRRRRRS